MDFITLTNPSFHSVRIEAGSYSIMPMNMHHALSLSEWGRHESNLYREYNYCDMTESELAGWYALRSTWDNRYFAIADEMGRCIGFIGLKEIQRFRKRSTLGFAIDKNRIGQGIGSRALRHFLPVYFHELGFQSINLFTYAYNERAFHVYKKLGFSVVDITVDEVRNPDNFPSQEEIETYPDAFIRTREGYFFSVYQMRLTRSAFMAGGYDAVYNR